MKAYLWEWTTDQRNAKDAIAPIHKYASDTTTLLKLGDHEYVTGITFVYNGYTGISNMNHGLSSAADIYLCDSTGGNHHKLGNTGMLSGARWYDTAGGGNWYPTEFVRNQLNVSGVAWKDLMGKTLYIKKSETGSYHGITAYKPQGYPPAEIEITTAILQHEIAWTDPSLSLSQNEYELTATMGGYATDNWGGTPTYYLEIDDEEVGTFTNGTVTVTLTDEQLEIPHTFKLVAISTVDHHIVGSVGVSESYTPHSVHKTVKYWDGSSWIECYGHVYDNGEWVEVEPHYWNGSDWVPCSHT